MTLWSYTTLTDLAHRPSGSALPAPRRSPSYWGPDLPLPAPTGGVLPIGAGRPRGDRGRASDGATCWAGSSTSTNALLEGRSEVSVPFSLELRES